MSGNSCTAFYKMGLNWWKCSQTLEGSWDINSGTVDAVDAVCVLYKLV